MADRRGKISSAPIGGNIASPEDWDKFIVTRPLRRGVKRDPGGPLMSAFGPLSLRQLEVFHAVMETGTVTAAAQSLHISQPTVSTILRRMEDQLRFPLFRTNRGRLVPTNEARILYESLERSFEQIQSISSTIETLRHGASHRISIATIQPLANSLVARALSTFLAEKPEARIHLLIRPRKDVVHAVAVEGVDVGLSFRTGDAVGLRAEPLCTGKVYCIMPHGHPLEVKSEIGPDDLMRYPIVSYTPGHQWLLSQLTNVLEPYDPLPEPVLTVESIVSVYPLVSEGVGLGLVDEFSLRLYGSEKISARPFRPTIEVGVDIIYPTGRTTPDLLKAFIQHLRLCVQSTYPDALPTRKPSSAAALA